MVVTTIVTTYNHKAFIAEALESAVAQKGAFTHEILVADDASTDGTREIVRTYAERYPDLIRDISSDRNLGISANMKRCFAAATGRYVAVLEGDDYWTDDRKLEKQVRYLESHAECSMTFSRVRFRRGEEYFLLPRQDGLPAKIYYGDLVGSQDMNPICNFSCCLFRREYLQIMPDVMYEHRLSEVTVAFFHCLLGPIGYMRECLSVYRLHEHGVFAGAEQSEKMLQALRTFQTVRKVADFGAWPVLNEFIESIKRTAYVRADETAPRLSIVTITRNNLDGLKKTASSVAGQTWRDFEWIVADGGSTDDTREYLKNLPEGVARWTSEPDEGIYDAINKGISRARGEYVICMNAGDAFRDAETLRQVFSHHPHEDVVYGDWVRKYPHHEEFCAAPKVLPPFYFFMPKCNICHQAMFVKTRLLQESKFDTRYYIAGDWAKWRQLMMDGCSFRYVPVTVCNFEASEGVSSNQTFRNVLDGIRLQTEYPVGMLLQGRNLREHLDRERDFASTHKLVAHLSALWRIVSWFPRKLLGGIRCLEENGWAYTVRNFRGKCCVLKVRASKILRSAIRRVFKFRQKENSNRRSHEN